jgi:hypothetical protein
VTYQSAAVPVFGAVSSLEMLLVAEVFIAALLTASAGLQTFPSGDFQASWLNRNSAVSAK